MADNRKSLTRSLYLNGALAVAVLTVLVYILLARASSSAGATGPTRETLTGTLALSWSLMHLPRNRTRVTPTDSRQRSRRQWPLRRLLRNRRSRRRPLRAR